jgi:hypothetical protein
MPYEEDLPKRLPPPWRDERGVAFGRAVGRRLDSVVQSFREAVFARLPVLAPADALKYHGKERQIDRGPTETDEAYALRLQTAWDAWAGDDTPFTGAGGGAASHLGMLRALQGIGIPMGPSGAIIVQQNGRYVHLDGAGNLVVGTLMFCVNRQNLAGAIESRPGWTFEARDNFYSEFGIVFPIPTVFDPAALNAVVTKWRPSKALFIGTWVIESGRVLGWPTGRTLGTEPNLGGNVVTFYPGPGAQRIGYTAG